MATITSINSILILLMPAPGYSHHKTAAILGQELSRRGHNVTLFFHVNHSATWKNINIYYVNSKLVTGYFSKYKFNPDQYLLTKSVLGTIGFFKVAFELRQCSYDIIEDSHAMDIINRTDLIIGELGLKHPLYMAKCF